MLKPGTSIGFMTSAHLDGFYSQLCGHLKEMTGIPVHFYVNGEESLRNHQWLLDEGSIDSITNAGRFGEFASENVDEREVIERAQEMERFIGIPYNHVLMSRREAGRGFALGGLYHPHSPLSLHSSESQILNGLTKTLTFWQKEFDEKHIGLFINGTKETAVMCRAMGLSFRTLYSSRFRNYYYWAHDEFVEPPNLEKIYNSLKRKACPPVILDEPYAHDTATRKIFVGNNGLLRFLKFAGHVLIRDAYLRAKGYRTNTNYFPSSLVHYHWRYYRDGRRLRAPYTKPLSDLEGRPFVFFPLQTEPEFSLQVMSPECFCQLGVIASLARDLPAGVKLVVKETIWGLGRRPRDFYTQILEFKNVVLLDVEERGLDVIKKSTAVATISGSAGIEAALTGTPVILFGRHNGYQFLPHVIPVGREEELAPAILQIFNGHIDDDEAVAAGRRFGEALSQMSFDMGQLSAFKKDGWSEENVKMAVSELLKSIGWAKKREKKKRVRQT